MCGITGFLGDFHDRDTLAARARAMAERIRHRGPDDEGVWTDPQHGLALAHRRLSILDLSPEGHQPMASADGRYWIVFNGEVYNHAELRAALEAKESVQWRGHSDTEVMLAAFRAWGVEESLRRFVGMFAFALWDRETRRLTLARDRFGEKPLYYGRQGPLFIFGSELKPLRAHPDFHPEIDRDALAMMLRFCYIPAPRSIYRGIHKLPPGTFITIDANQAELPDPVPYWSARAVAEQGQRQPFSGDAREAVDELERVLGNAVAGQMVADVPLGAFLSGGIDSTSIVALMQARSSQPVKTFTIGFWEKSFNEAGHAKAVAQHLGTEHTELYVTPEQALGVIPRIPSLYDEPYADSSQIPTFLVSELARRHVTVSLSGDAGDELFGGYRRYARAPDLWRKLARRPAALRQLAAAGLTALSPRAWDRLFQALRPMIPSRLHHVGPGAKLHALAGRLTAEHPEQIYFELVSLWKDPDSVVIGSREPRTVLNDPALWPPLDDFQHRMMLMDTLTYLPDDILVKVDRAAMGVSLESRVPLLDHRVAEFAWTLPLDLKIRDGQGKWPLRQILYRHVPREIVDRPKMGFAVPLADWLRGPLREWSEALIDPRRLAGEGYLRPEPIQALWQDHLASDRNWSYYLWNVLVFQTWLETQNL